MNTVAAFDRHGPDLIVVDFGTATTFDVVDMDGAYIGGAIAPGGRLAVNTNGGGLSCNHPGMYGLFTLLESVQQLRGEAGERQVPDARVSLAHANGGVLSSQATAILGTADTL